MVKCINFKRVNVRKPTICFGCNREFPIGTEMELQTMRDDTLYSIHLCLTCEQLVEKLIPNNSIYYEGDFEELAIKHEQENN